MPSTRVPPELWLAIFELACTDTGRTGRSLALVSKEFYRLVVDTGMDIRNTQICGDQEAKSFIKMLERREVSQRGVRSLFFADREVSNPDMIESVEVTADWSADLMNVLSLIDIARLRSLSLYQRDGSNSAWLDSTIQPTLSLALPHLTNLSIESPGLSTQFLTKYWEHVVIAPNLTSLCLHGHIQVPSNLDALISTLAPNLEYLILSDCGPVTIHDLIKSFKTTSESTTSSTAYRLSQARAYLSLPNFPQSLRRVTVRPAPFVELYQDPLFKLSGLEDSVYDPVVESVRELIRLNDEMVSVGAGKVMILPVPESIKYSEVEERRFKACLEDWLTSCE